MAGYPRIGASPDGGLTWTLPQAVGYEQAMRFRLENRTVDADEAQRLGFVGAVVDDERLEARLAEYCALFAERAPLANRLTKRAIARATAIDLEDHLILELRTSAAPSPARTRRRPAGPSSRSDRRGSGGAEP